MPESDLRERGLKTTLPRMKILAILESAGAQHLSADDIHARLLEGGEDIALATIYRVLTQFETAGLVVKHNFEEGYAVYELDDGEHHDHLICTDCQHVQEFVDDVIESRQEALADRYGFKITHHQLYLYGQCQRANCPYRQSLKPNTRRD